MPDLYRDYEFFKCKGNGYVTSKKRMCHYESCGNDQKATKISYFVFYYPLKEMVALLMILLAGSILVPGIFLKKFYGKADTK